MNPEPLVNVEGQLQNFFSLLATPEGIVLMATFLVVIAPLVLYFRQLKWTVMALMLWVTTLGFEGNDSFFSTQRVLIFPLEQLRRQGRGLSILLLMTLLLACFGLVRGWRARLISSPALAFFGFQMIMCLRLLAAGNVARAAVGGLIFVATFLVLCILWPRALQRWEDVMACVRAIAAVGIVFVITNLLQFIHDPTSLAISGRFQGTTANPQHAATTLGMALPAVLYLLVHPGRARLARVLLAAVASLMVVFLLWSGSRTGVLMGTVGVLVLFRARLGKFAVSAAICALLVYFAMSFFSDAGLQAGRVLSTEDTRSGVWGELIQDFVRSPIVGSVGNEISIRESSYLSVAAQFGMVGLIPFGIAMALVCKTLVDLLRVRKQLDDPMIVDLITAGLLSIAAGAVFEGLLLGMISMQTFLIYIYLGLATFLLDYAALQRGEQMMTNEHADEFAYSAVPDYV